MMNIVLDGNDIEIKVGDHPSAELAVFKPLSGVRITALRLRSSIYNQRDIATGGWIKALSRAGQQQLEISLQGVYHQQDAEALLQYYAFEQSHFPLQYLKSGIVSFEMTAQLSRFEWSNPKGNPQSYQASLVSTSPVINYTF